MLTQALSCRGWSLLLQADETKSIATKNKSLKYFQHVTRKKTQRYKYVCARASGAIP